MKALVFDGNLHLAELPIPVRKQGDVLIRIVKAGICNTDHEIVAGYMPGFTGVLGHEFIGVIEKADDKIFIRKRATAEINCGCGTCDYCKSGMERHCPHRTVIGIQGRDGAFAEYISVPAENAVVIPDSIPDLSAVFIEPLAAALEIKDQVPLENTKVLLVGDGKLGILIAHVLSTIQCETTVVGHHPETLNRIRKPGAAAIVSDEFQKTKFDVVIEASGNPDAFQLAVECTKPRGTLVLKSTFALSITFNPSPLVVNEITMVGSRCGRFSEAIRFLEMFKPDFSWMIAKEFGIKDGMEAFEYSKKAGILKVLLKM